MRVTMRDTVTTTSIVKSANMEQLSSSAPDFAKSGGDGHITPALREVVEGLARQTRSAEPVENHRPIQMKLSSTFMRPNIKHQPITRRTIVKTTFGAVLLAATVFGSMPLLAQPAHVNSTGGRSPHETTSNVIGDRRSGCRVTITYGRPFAKGRKIWGAASDKALVPDGQPWRLGADEATTLITQQPLKFGDTTIPAGAYTLYMIPQSDGASKLAFSSKLGGWGIPVDQSHDVARVDLKKETPEKPVEELTMAVTKDSSGNGGAINISWDDAHYSAPFTVVK